MILQKIKDSLVGKICICITKDNKQQEEKKIHDVEEELCWYKLIHGERDNTYIHQLQIKQFIKGKRIEYGDKAYSLYKSTKRLNG